MDPRKSSIVLAIIGAFCFLIGVATNFFWCEASVKGDIWGPSFSSIFWDFDGPYDDNTIYAGWFNVIGLALIAGAAVLFFGRKQGDERDDHDHSSA